MRQVLSVVILVAALLGAGSQAVAGEAMALAARWTWANVQVSAVSPKAPAAQAQAAQAQAAQAQAAPTAQPKKTRRNEPQAQPLPLLKSPEEIRAEEARKKKAETGKYTRQPDQFLTCSKRVAAADPSPDGWRILGCPR